MSFPNSPLSSGSRVPVLIDVSFPKFPAIVITVSEGVHVEMRRNITVWHGRNGRKALDVHHSHVVSTAKRVNTLENASDGYRRLAFSLQAGVEGKECSWALDGLVSVEVSVSYPLFVFTSLLTFISIPSTCL
jgi:hypothetical protein